MKTREWLFTIAIVILIQFIVQVGALTFSSDNNVLNYISFAGTIVSIILATIAIVYSFVQTISQQSSASNISNQVDKLMSVVGVIDESKKTIKTSIQHLNEASKRLDTAIENQTKINTTVETISNHFSNEKFLRLLNAESTAITKIDSNAISLYEKIFAKGGNAIIITSISLYYGKKINIPQNEIVTKIISPAAIKALNLVDNDTSIDSFHQGMFSTGYQVLFSLDLIETDHDNNYVLSKEFELECENQIKQSQENDEYHNDFAKKIITEIIKVANI